MSFNVNSGISKSETAVHSSSLDLLERKILLATEGSIAKFSEYALRDRDRISEENALFVAEYIIAMKREINPRPSYIQNTIQFLVQLSKLIDIGNHILIELLFPENHGDNIIKLSRLRVRVPLGQGNSFQRQRLT